MPPGTLVEYPAAEGIWFEGSLHCLPFCPLDLLISMGQKFRSAVFAFSYLAWRDSSGAANEVGKTRLSRPVNNFNR